MLNLSPISKTLRDSRKMNIIQQACQVFVFDSDEEDLPAWKRQTEDLDKISEAGAYEEMGTMGNLDDSTRIFGSRYGSVQSRHNRNQDSARKSIRKS